MAWTPTSIALLLGGGGAVVAAGTAAVLILSQPDEPETPSEPTEESFHLQFPLDCADRECDTAYVAGAYEPGMINSLVDHSLVRSSGGNWQYGNSNNGGGDGIIVAFDGSRIEGAAQANDPTCLTGSQPLGGLMNSRGCGAGYVSYDEHPGYDYRAESGLVVKAAASGTIVKNGTERCIRTNITVGCDAWGYVGIDHGNGYITQYGHLSRIDVEPGQEIGVGDTLGLTGSTAPQGINLGPHLHFEVIKKVGDEYLVVDPYGWSGEGDDPLYSVEQAGNPVLWANERDLANLPPQLDNAVAYCLAKGTIGSAGPDFSGPEREQWMRDVLGVLPQNDHHIVFWRCESQRVLACVYSGVGTHDPCAVWSTNSSPTPQMNDFCRQNPEMDVPWSVKGPSIYDWTCRGTTPVTRARIVDVDGRGFLTEGAWIDITDYAPIVQDGSQATSSNSALFAPSVQLWYPESRRHSKNILTSHDFYLWNTGIGEGSAEEPTSVSRYSIKVRRNGPDDDRKLRLSATDSRGRVLSQRSYIDIPWNSAGIATVELDLQDFSCGQVTFLATYGSARSSSDLLYDCGE